MTKFVAGLAAIKKGFIAAKVAVIAFNATNPVGWIALAVSGLIALGALIFKFRKQIMAIGETFKEYVSNLYRIYKTKDSFLDNQFVPYYDTELQKLLNNLPNNPYILPQWLYLYDIDGETPLYDKVFKLNQLPELFDWATSINNDRGIKIRALYNPKVNVSSNKIHHYNVYDDDMINQVGEMYKKDIDLFNFEY